MNLWGRGKQKQEEEPRDFHEKAFRRSDLARWDTVWHSLSKEARKAYLDRVKGPVKSRIAGTDPPDISEESLGKEVSRELLTAGLLEPSRALKSRLKSGRFSATDAAYDFATRVRGLARYHLLDAKKELRFDSYLDWACEGYALFNAIERITRGSDSGWDGMSSTHPFRLFFQRQWPEFVARSVKIPAAGKVLAALLEAGKPVPIVEVPGLVPNSDPVEVRKALDSLIAYIALVEGIDPETLDVMVGYLPKVLESIHRASRPYVRAPLEFCLNPKELGPSGSPYVDDLRAILLEIAGEPPRLRKDGMLFAKEEERFESALEPWPEWVETVLGQTVGVRMARAFSRAQRLKFLRVTQSGSRSQFEVDSEGKQWLSSSLEAQITYLFDRFRRYPSEVDYGVSEVVLEPDPSSLLSDWVHSYMSYDRRGLDARFLGTMLGVKLGKVSKNEFRQVEPKETDFGALRASLLKTFEALEPGTFLSIGSFLEHFTRGRDNFLLCGLTLDQIQITYNRQRLPSEEDLLEEAARFVLFGILLGRLIPLGCVAAARDEKGGLLLSGTPLLPAYFGSKPLKEGALGGGAAPSDSKVVIQPDFSVVVIGLSPAPVAELSPFAERVSGSGASGAKTLKITRDSIVRAVARGMTPQEIIDRLKRLASHDPPPNVLKEIQTWGSSVRLVQAEILKVIRCPDSATADRVAGVLKKATRIGETILEVDPKLLTSVVRDRLRVQGIVLEGRFPKDLGASPKKAIRRRSGW